MGKRPFPAHDSPFDFAQGRRLATHDFLLEIGCEELPADYLPAALDLEDRGPAVAGGLASSAAGALDGKGIVWESLQSFGTSRRLVLYVQGVQPIAKKWRKGPPISVAYDAQGKPTRAAEAFAARHGVKVSQLKREETPKGPVVLAEYDEPAIKNLSEAIQEMIQRIVFPKTMRWDGTGVRFARPVRWVLALYGSKVVPSLFGAVRSGGVTYGTRRLGGKPVKVSEAKGYFSQIRRLHVELEQGISIKKEKDSNRFERHPVKKENLRKRLEQTAKCLGGSLPEQKTEEFQWLLNTLTFLAEDPVVQAGTFRKEYLALPAEVLATAMAKHLKLLSLSDSNGEKLLPKFLAVLEGQPKKSAEVIANMERVLEARFADARFFYQEDTRTPLEEKVPELERIVFHEKLGSVAERIPRIERLMKAIAQGLNLPSQLMAQIPHVARLAKADLVTSMVREFPSLQGTMGGHYLRENRQPFGVAEAVAQQYWPRTANDPLPIDWLGAVLSLGDRLDTLLGYFGAGMKPTGSLDPYALRRQALGVVRILIESPSPISFVGLSIDRLFDDGIQSWGLKVTVEPNQLKKELRLFLRERFEWLAFARERIGRELIAAVLAADESDLAGAWDRLKILRELWTRPEEKDGLLRAAKVAERTGRIVHAGKQDDCLGRVDPAALKEASEKKLWEVWNKVEPVLQEQVRLRRYREAVTTYSTLYAQIHEFFETVFVMDEDMNIRRNRLALMNEIYQSLSGSFADLSKLPLAGTTA